MIIRRSITHKLSSDPYIVQWDAEYSGGLAGKDFVFADSMQHRAFSRFEFAEHLSSGGFEVLEQGDNFDETSFYTLARHTP